MRTLINYTFWFLLPLFLLACGGDDPEPDPLTVAELLAKRWQVDRVLINGQEDNSGSFSNFQITFVAPDGTPTTYTVQPGAAPDLPNLTDTNAGQWILESNDTRIVLDQGTVNEATISIIEVTEERLIIQWTVPESIDKNTPQYRLELSPTA